MDTQNRGDLVINGFGASNGGTFNHVTINGKGTINSDVECNKFECNGSGSVKGNVNSIDAMISGSVKLSGSIDCQKLTIDGTAKIAGNLFVEKLRVAGKATIGGKIKSDEIKIKGRLTVEGDCEAEAFKAESQFMIGGLLNADDVKIEIFGECKAKEIGGQTILVKQKSSMLGLFLPFIQTQLETEIIEGDIIELENTSAKVVRGNQVKIGPNCQIGVVEYTGELSVDKNAVVGESRKV